MTNKLIIVGIVIAIALGAASLYFQIGEEVLSGVTHTFNPCIGYYDTFAPELKKRGIFTSETTREVNTAWINFLTEDCLSTIPLWMPETPDRKNDKEFVWSLKWAVEINP